MAQDRDGRWSPVVVAIVTTGILATATIVAAVIERGPDGEDIGAIATSAAPTPDPATTEPELGPKPESKAPTTEPPDLAGNEFEQVYQDREFTLSSLITRDRVNVVDLDAPAGQDLVYETHWDEWATARDQGGPTPRSADLAMNGSLETSRNMAVSGPRLAPGPDDAAGCRQAAADGTVEVDAAPLREGDVVCVITSADGTARLSLNSRTERDDLIWLTFTVTLWASS